ncbi:hypothetical protein C8J56DRAFT_369611 [Mycena floridula]|nr:hypothetical protein C8J56DRAFT_369611 [Mycena floridula]
MISGLLLLLVPAIGGLSSLQAAICCWILIHRPVFLPSLSLYLGMNINRSRRKVQPPLVHSPAFSHAFCCLLCQLACLPALSAIPLLLNSWP